MIYKTFMMGKNKKQLLIVINAIKKTGHCDREKECVCGGGTTLARTGGEKTSEK